MTDSYKTEYRRREVISKNRLLLLSLWIISLTLSLDFIFELKLFDVIAFIGMFVFRKEIALKNLFRGSAVEKWSVLFVLCAFWGVIVTFVSNQDLSWMPVVIIRFYRFIGYIALFLIIRNINISKEHLLKLYNMVFLAALIQALLIVLQKFGLAPTLQPGVYRGTLDPNHVNLVTFMTVGIATTIGKLYRISLKNLVKVFSISLSALSMALTMIIGQARSGFLALAILIVCQVRKTKGIVIIIMACISLLIVQIVTDYDFIEIGRNVFQDRVVRKLDTKRHFRGYLDWDFEVIDKGRPYIWKTTLEIIAKNPSYLIFGTGFQNFGSIRGTTSAHNNFLQILAELGLLGLIVFVFWLKTIWKELNKWKSIDRKLYEYLSIPGVACFLAIVAVAFFNEPLYAHRNSPGFLGYFLAYCAIITNDGWVNYEENNASK